MRLITVSGLACLGVAGLLHAASEAKQTIHVTNTERVDFPAGGTLRIKNGIGVLWVEGWDRPDAEITTIKSSKHEIAPGAREKSMRVLDQVHVTAQVQGQELVVSTDYPRWRAWPPPSPVSGEINFDLEYRIKVPSSARFIGNHAIGEVTIYGLTGDIEETMHQGALLLHLPEDAKYAINAKVDAGTVNSDYTGEVRNRRWVVGHRLVHTDAPAPHKLTLRVGWGDILLLKTTIPQEPPPMALPKTGGGL